MYRNIALVALLLSVSSLSIVEAKEKKAKWAPTEKTCSKIDTQIKKAEETGDAKKIKTTANRKAKCVAKGL
ncbi:hypothetical protein RGQ13_02155 [Thalassotalea psychrophila]|uniref:Uncharacterized protein n=1 Tax=Thalassotalea psychrophila TaxID=3065647 RepID=A0ABY9TZA1_9GAMM|nr:hypothetical protein RGQ13_02155 [Colwelliaceae bacterium SQ149]